MREQMLQLIRQNVPVQTVPGTVLAVNKAEASVDVQPLERNAPELFDVRLRAVDDDQLNGLILWPQVGSIVLVSLIDNDLNTAFVSYCSEVESFTLSTPEESLLPWLQDLLQALQQLVLLTNAGATTGMLPQSLQQLQKLSQRLPNLLTA